MDANTEPADLNKTELTLRVTQAAASWLAGIGCKPVESEVPIDRGWVADLAGLWNPTRTEATAQRLIPHPPKYVYPRTPEQTAQATARNAEREAAYASIRSPLTVLVEVKTSKSDYCGDKKWTREWPANVCIVAMPAGMVPEDKWPLGWWVIEYREANNVCAIRRRGERREISDSQKIHFCSQIAHRCHNRTANAFWRDLARSHRNRETEDVNRVRFDAAVSHVLDYVDGTDESILFAYRAKIGKRELPRFTTERLEKLKQRLQGGMG